MVLDPVELLGEQHFEVERARAPAQQAANAQRGVQRDEQGQGGTLASGQQRVHGRQRDRGAARESELQR